MKPARLVLVTVLLAFLAAAAPAFAGETTDMVKATVDEVIAVLKDPSLKGPDKAVERRDRIREVIRKRFGFEEMARRSLGKHWKALSGDQRREFAGLFGRLVENSYIDKVEGYSDEKIVYEDERTVKNTSIVKTKLITKKGTEIPIHYKLVNRARKGWVVYDIVIEGVSLVRNYRSQFASVMRSSTYQDLVAQLKAKL